MNTDSPCQASKSRDGFNERGLAAFNAGDLDEAEGEFTIAGDYQHSGDYLQTIAEQLEKAELERKESLYREARDDHRRKDYGTARSKFTQVGDYKGAQRYIERINEAGSREDMRKLREAEAELDRLDRELATWFRSEGR